MFSQLSIFGKFWIRRAASGGAGGQCPPIFVFAPPINFLPPHGTCWGGKSCWFWPEKTLEFVISARNSLQISAKTFFFFWRSPDFGRKNFRIRYLIFTETSPQSNSGRMKKLCPPDFNFAPPPRSREAGDAPVLNVTVWVVMLEKIKPINVGEGLVPRAGLVKTCNNWNPNKVSRWYQAAVCRFSGTG